MRKLSNRSSNRPDRSGWRDYQNRLGNGVGSGCRRRCLTRLLAVLLVVAGFYGLNGLWREDGGSDRSGTAQASLPKTSVPELTSKEDLRKLFNRRASLIGNLATGEIELSVNQQLLQVKTSLDEDLQSYLLDKMDRKNSRYIGIVVMEADTGRVLAMAGFDKTEEAGNPCLRGDYPAASIFKIVTAASAVDACGLNAESKLGFNGYKHTLYKRQLKEGNNRYTSTVSLKDAFAQSINPVFGKIGQLRLGKSLLAKSAEAFGFNGLLDFELPLQPSRFLIGDQPYNWAEIASGFNRETTMSPLHGAVMVTAVLNEGSMVAPSLVDEIDDPDGKTLYSRKPPAMHPAMSANASAVLGQLMETTIASGTSRKAFRGYQRDKILSRLQIGGKTGSIGNTSQDARIDWFVGFAKERQGTKQLAVAVMVAHEEYIGIRASQYARMAMTRYFGSHPAEADPKKSGKSS